MGDYWCSQNSPTAVACSDHRCSASWGLLILNYDHNFAVKNLLPSVNHLLLLVDDVRPLQPNSQDHTFQSISGVRTDVK